MKVSFFVGEEELIVHVVDILDLKEFFELIKSCTLSLDGYFIKVTNIEYDVSQHSFDVLCEKVEA